MFRNIAELVFTEYSPFRSFEERDNTIKVLLARSIREGIGITESSRELRSIGFTFPDRRFRELYGEVLAADLTGDRIRRVGRDKTPTEAIFGLTPYNQPERYRFLVEFKYYDFTTDTTEIGGRWFDTSILMTRGEIESITSDILNRFYPEVGETATEFRIRNAWIAPNIERNF